MDDNEDLNVNDEMDNTSEPMGNDGIDNTDDISLSEEMKLELGKMLTSNYFIKEGDSEYHYDSEPDYRDNLDQKDIKKILSDEDPRMAFYSLFDEADMYAMDGARDFAKECIEREWEDTFDEDTQGTFEELEQEVLDWISENVFGSYDTSSLLDTEVRCDLIIDTGDANLDYSLGYESLDTDENGDPVLPDESPFIWLAETQGYTREQITKAITGDFEGSKFLKSVYVEVINCTTSMNALGFFGTCSLKTLIEMKENKEDKKSIPIKVGTPCGLYDAWNGAGGTLEIELEKDLVVPAEFIGSFSIDGSRGYSIDEIYGMTGKFWDTTFSV